MIFCQFDLIWQFEAKHLEFCDFFRQTNNLLLLLPFTFNQVIIFLLILLNIGLSLLYDILFLTQQELNFLIIYTIHFTNFLIIFLNRVDYLARRFELGDQRGWRLGFVVEFGSLTAFSLHVVVSVQLDQVLFYLVVAFGKHVADVKLPLTHLTNLSPLMIPILRIDSLFITTLFTIRICAKVTIPCIFVRPVLFLAAVAELIGVFVSCIGFGQFENRILEAELKLVYLISNIDDKWLLPILVTHNDIGSCIHV